MDTQKETPAQCFTIAEKMDTSASPEVNENDSPNSSQKWSNTVCTVPGCKSRYGRSVSFHSFPKKDDKRWKTWIKKLKLKYEPTSNARVCSSHFSISNFVSPTTSRLTDRMVLKNSAIPDMNLPQPPQSATLKQLSAERAARITRREQEKMLSSNELSMEIDENLNLSPTMVVQTTEAAVQVDTLEMDKKFQGRRRTMAVVFKTDAELNSWTGLNSLKMLDSIEQSRVDLPIVDPLVASFHHFARLMAFESFF